MSQVANVEVMAKGQITLPKEIRDALGVGMGDRVTFIQKDNQVIMMNTAVYALQMLQKAMQGEAEASGLASEDKVNALISDMRKGLSL